MEHPRLKKALSEKMSLLSATQTENNWTFKVRGQSSNIYEQVLTSDTYSCSCPDQQGKKTFCKHLLFLVTRVAKQYELGNEVAQRPKTTWKKTAFSACSASWKSCLSHLLVTEPVVTASSLDIDPHDSCCVCFEEMGSENLIQCPSSCKKHFHKVCIDRWLEHGDTCPTCRGDWELEDNSETITAVENVVVGEVLVNHVEEVRDIKTDLVISFDTTGSMYPCLAEVKRNTASLTERLFREIPSLRVSIIAHGDYCDKDKTITTLDFTDDQEKIKKFITDAPSTNGGDFPECYELVLRTCKSLSWRTDATMKSLILIGDAPPHGKNENPEKIDWREETESLKNRNIQIFSVQCLNNGNRESFSFYSEIAMTTNGYHVFLDQFSYIKDMIQAICFKQYNQDHLEQFEKELQEGRGGMSESMRLMFDTMLGKKTREQARDEMHPDRFRERYHRSSPSSSSFSFPRATRSGPVTATPSSVRESELMPSPPSRFQVFNVDEDINIKEFCSKMGITFTNGRGFYEFTKPEIISDKKEIILMEKTTGALYEGDAARSIAGIGSTGNARVKPGDLPRYRMFIQSTSPARKLISGQGFLYEVE
jgi:hypothetical protein